jgi:hypothetical protein
MDYLNTVFVKSTYIFEKLQNIEKNPRIVKKNFMALLTSSLVGPAVEEQECNVGTRLPVPVVSPFTGIGPVLILSRRFLE